MTAERNRSWQPNPDVVAERLGEVVMLIHLGTNRIYQLNATGGALWDLLQEGNDEVQIRRQLLRRFDVSEGPLEEEMGSLISRLATEKLILERSRP